MSDETTLELASVINIIEVNIKDESNICYVILDNESRNLPELKLSSFSKKTLLDEYHDCYVFDKLHNEHSSIMEWYFNRTGLKVLDIGSDIYYMVLEEYMKEDNCVILEYRLI